jgi:hypothetical protein
MYVIKDLVLNLLMTNFQRQAMDNMEKFTWPNISCAKPSQAQAWEALVEYWLITTAERLGETWYIQQGLTKGRARVILT